MHENDLNQGVPKNVTCLNVTTNWMISFQLLLIPTALRGVKAKEEIQYENDMFLIVFSSFHHTNPFPGMMCPVDY